MHRHQCEAVFIFPTSSLRNDDEFFATFSASVKAAIGGLKGWEVSDDPCGPLELRLNYFTKKYRWLDVVSCIVVPGEARVVVQSFSTNVCPTGPLVARLCRPLCGWVTVFSDGGQNRQHILQLARTLYANGVELRVEVRSSSDSFKGPLALTDKKTQ